MTDILQATEKYVTDLFKSKSVAKLFYHNIEHTQNVVKAAALIAKKCNVNGRQLEAVLVAAWFHDVGYLETKNNHEDISKQEARNFLSKNGISPFYIEQVEKCIEATRIPQNPTDQLSAILCDADLYNVSQGDFMDSASNFWSELAALNGKKSSIVKYINITLTFFQDHEFKTEYGRTVLEPGKKSNIDQMKLALEEELKATEEEIV